MAHQTGDVAVLQAYSTHELSSSDALDAATIAENALDADDFERCSEALEFGAECVAAVGRRTVDDHLHVPMRNLQEAISRARTALEVGHETADARAEQAITALRQTVVTVDQAATVSAPALGHRYL